MKNSSKLMRIGVLIFVMLIAITITLVSCKQTDEPEGTAGTEEVVKIPTKNDVANSINGYVEQMFAQIPVLEDPEAIDFTNILKALSDVNVTIDNPSSDDLFGGPNKIIFANNTLRAEGTRYINGQKVTASRTMKLGEHGIILLFSENGKYEGEYLTWTEMFDMSGENTFTLSQIDFEAIQDALKIEESDVKIVEEGVYQIKSSYIINAIKDITKILGFESADNSASLNTLLNMSLVVDVRQYQEGIMIIDLDIPEVIEAKLSILDKEQFKVDYEIYILGGNEASTSDPAASFKGTISLKADEFNLSMLFDVPSESMSCKIECTGRNVESQLSANCKINIKAKEGDSITEVRIEAQVSAETNDKGDITFIDGEAFTFYNEQKILSATLDYNVTDSIASGKCLIEIQYAEEKNSDRVILEGTLSAKLNDDNQPVSVAVDFSAIHNDEELVSVSVDYAISTSERGEKTIAFNAELASPNITIIIESEIKIDNNKLLEADIQYKMTTITHDQLSDSETILPLEPKPETFAVTISIDTVSSSELSTKYHCVFGVIEGDEEFEAISFDITFGGAQINLTNDEKMLIEYYESLLANYNEYVIRSEDYANAVRQMAEQGILPAVLPESFCLIDPENHKVGYLCDIYKKQDGTYEVYCSIDVNDPLNSHLEYYPVIETFFPEN